MSTFFVQRIEDPQEWERFNLAQLNTLFVQSPNYGEFYKKMGESFFILGIYDTNRTLVGGSLVVTVHAKRGDFLLLPLGPILPKEKSEEAFTALTGELILEAKKQKIGFIRATPFLEDTEEHQELFRRAGYKKAPMHVFAEHTSLLDITPPSDVLLAQMKKNHRNLIRRCEREGVRVVLQTVTEAIEPLDQLMDTTVKRHGFHRFSKKYMTAQFESFSASGNVVIFQAFLPDGRLDASAMIFYYGTMGAYYHGASLNLDPRLPSSYLLQWTAIQEAKRRGCLWYNFWGIAPPNATKSHPFFGVTHFKQGFGGGVKHLLPAHDLPISWKYPFTWTIETVRRFYRGFES